MTEYPHQAPERSLHVAPPALRGLVRYFHVERGGSGPVVVPATPYPMVTFFISGGSLVHELDGSVTHYRIPFVSGPIRSAIHSTGLPGSCFISAICEPSRFGALFGIALRDLRARPLPLAEIAPHLETDAVQERLFAAGSPAVWVDVLSEWLLALARLREDRLRSSFWMPPALLFSPTGNIATAFGLSVRQLERKHTAAYGLTLIESRRMLRYAGALGLLIGTAGQRGLLTRIAGAAGYQDQSHMIRDFREFLGIAPGALVAGQSEAHGVLRMLRYDRDELHIIEGGHGLPSL